MKILLWEFFEKFSEVNEVNWFKFWQSAEMGEKLASDKNKDWYWNAKIAFDVCFDFKVTKDVGLKQLALFSNHVKKETNKWDLKKLYKDIKKAAEVKKLLE